MDIAQIKEVAWVADQHVSKPIRGVVLVFHGLGNTDLRGDPGTDELSFLRAGGLVVYPYSGPWSWMNRQTRAFIDDLVESVYAAYKLDPSTPLIATGGSMGGFSALLYTRYARRTPDACMAVFPCCDIKHHFTERPDLPRTIRYAFRGYPEPWEEVLAEHSPIEQVEHMPDIPYLIFHGEADKTVSKAHHSDRFVAAMRKLGRRVRYVEVPGMGHGTMMPLEVVNERVAFVTGCLKK
ncbi:MAG: prolyl oligopeptidase family serine peptidase [Phycisphaeraceae bacterium]|nr:prolyl oligopeptidase family serine peptidase [Phycisphaeraceae bacterium]